jgi:hypothetical protein
VQVGAEIGVGVGMEAETEAEVEGLVGEGPGVLSTDRPWKTYSLQDHLLAWDLTLADNTRLHSHRVQRSNQRAMDSTPIARSHVSNILAPLLQFYHRCSGHLKERDLSTYSISLSQPLEK